MFFFYDLAASGCVEESAFTLVSLSTKWTYTNTFFNRISALNTNGKFFLVFQFDMSIQSYYK